MADDLSREASAGGPERRALVVCHDKGAGFWPWVFGRPGFRHCLVALNDGRAWIVVDPCSDGVRVSADVAAEADLAAHYRALGYAVIETAVAGDGRSYRLPWAFTCVEAVKRILRVHGWWLWTPHQLYRYLEREHGKHLQSAEAEGAAASAASAEPEGSGHRRGAQARA